MREGSRITGLTALLSGALACAEPPASDRGGPPPRDPSETGPGGETGGLAPETAAPCAPEPDLGLEAAPRLGSLASQAALDVTAGREVSVVALCASDADPAEAHLVESADPARVHELRFLGLLPATDYTCRVAATCPTSGAPPAEVRFRTAEPPVELPALQVAVDPELGMTGEYTLAPWQGALGGKDPLILVWDAAGRPRWWWRVPEGVEIPIEVLLDRGTTRLLWGGGNHPDGRPTLVDLWEGVVDRAKLPPWGPDHYTHDTKRLPDGRILSLLYVPNTADGMVWQGFGVRIHDPATDAVEVEFDSQRLVDRGVLRPGAPGADPYHANWVDVVEGPGGPVLYVSLYGVQRILAIDLRTEEVLWDLGADRGWTVLGADGSSLPQEELPQGQHGLEVRGPDLLVYDNGVQRRESRASWWRIDPTTRTATRRWSWTEPGWFEPITGDVDDLGGGRVLVTQATAGCCAQPGDLTEVDEATGRVASRLTFPSVRHMGYRSERYGGCDLFARTDACPALAQRAAELGPLFDPAAR